MSLQQKGYKCNFLKGRCAGEQKRERGKCNDKDGHDHTLSNSPMCAVRCVGVSILALDTKAGEHPVYQDKKGRETVLISFLLRKILDYCATLDEAAEYAGNVNLANTFGHDFQLFAVDRDGNSGVMDWRYNELRLTRTDLAVNFYVSADDADGGLVPGDVPGSADAHVL